MSKIYVAIDVGCHECGVDSEVIGTFKAVKEAEEACTKRTEETGNWRDMGQSIPRVFEITVEEETDHAE